MSDKLLFLGNEVNLWCLLTAALDEVGIVEWEAGSEGELTSRFVEELRTHLVLVLGRLTSIDIVKRILSLLSPLLIRLLTVAEVPSATATLLGGLSLALLAG